MQSVGKCWTILKCIYILLWKFLFIFLVYFDKYPDMQIRHIVEMFNDILSWQRHDLFLFNTFSSLLSELHQTLCHIFSFQCSIYRCLSLCSLCDHCIVCPSLIYGFWLHLWYLHTLPTIYRLSLQVLYMTIYATYKYASIAVVVSVVSFICLSNYINNEDIKYKLTVSKLKATTVSFYYAITSH